MQPLVADMVQDDPAKRPSIDEVVTRFNAMRKKMGTIKLRSRVARREDGFSLFCYFAHVFTSIKYTLQGIPPIPTR